MSTRSERLARQYIEPILADSGVTIDGHNSYDLEVHDDRVFERVLKDREIGLGDSYLDGWWDCDALDKLAFRLVTAQAKSRLLPGPRVLGAQVTAIVSNRQKGPRAARNARKHYGQHDDLLELALDEQKTYSCAYWKDASCLAEAQWNKFALIADKLQIEPGMRVLDVGCGWGAFAAFLCEERGAVTTGITPVPEQASTARARLQGLPGNIHTTDFISFAALERYDRIVSIGMLEHIGSRNYGPFFAKCRDLLASDGLMLHQTIGKNNSTAMSDAWMDRHIFPGGCVPSIQQLSKAWSRNWNLRDMEDLGPNYDVTLLAWAENLVSNRDEVIGRFGLRMYRMFRYYFLTCAGVFRSQELHLWHLVFSHRLEAVPYDRRTQAVKDTSRTQQDDDGVPVFP